MNEPRPRVLDGVPMCSGSACPAYVETAYCDRCSLDHERAVSREIECRPSIRAMAARLAALEQLTSCKCGQRKLGVQCVRCTRLWYVNANKEPSE